MFLFYFMQVTWLAVKRLIDAKENNLILALDFHLLKGAHGTFWLGDDLWLKNIII